MRRILLICMCATGLFVAGCGEDTSTTTATPTPTETPAPETTTASCTSVELPEAKKDGGATRPKEKLDSSKDYIINVQTNCGSFSFELDQTSAPKTSRSLVSLAKQGFYDNTTFHRIVPSFVIQGGDPTGTGTGGPGYKTVDTPRPDTKYVKGSVAMAKSGAEKPGSSGSQFFVVLSDEGGAQLTPDYAYVGKVVKGQEVVDALGMLGDQTEQPTQPLVIQKMTVTVK